MTSSRRSPDRLGAPAATVSASTKERVPERPDDSHDAPEGLPGDDGNDDHDHHPHAAFHEADWYGHGDDDRLVSDISERYPKLSLDDVPDDPSHRDHDVSPLLAPFPVKDGRRRF